MKYIFETFFWLLVLLRSVTSEQTCYDGPDAVIVNEDADVFIGKVSAHFLLEKPVCMIHFLNCDS